MDYRKLVVIDNDPDFEWYQKTIFGSLGAVGLILIIGTLHAGAL